MEYNLERNNRVAELALGQARTGLSGQQDVLQSIRQRATTNIAISGVAASLLGSKATALDVNYPCVGFLVLLAIAAFFLSIAASVRVLQSSKGWTFHQSASQIEKNYVTDYPDLPQYEVLISTAKHLEDSYTKNRGQLDRLHARLNRAFWLTVGQIFIWIVAIAISTWNPIMAEYQQQPKNLSNTQQDSSPEEPPNIPNPGVEEERSSDPPLEPPVHIAPAHEK